MRRILLAGALFLLPAVAFGAGFAKESLFLSKSPVQEGDSVHIYAIVANEESTKFAGSVVINDGTQKLGSVPVSMDAGGTVTATLTWKPTAGSHTVTAELTAGDGTVVEKESAVFSIAAKPVPVVAEPIIVATSSAAAAIDSSAPLQHNIANVSPQLASFSAPVFSFFDGLRSKAAGFLDGQLENVKHNLSGLSQPGLVEGTSTLGVPSTSGSIWYIPWTIYLYILTLLRFLISNAAVFYPLVVAIFFYFLWRMYRRMRRPSWE